MKLKDTVFLMLMFWLIAGFAGYLWDSKAEDLQSYAEEKEQMLLDITGMELKLKVTRDWYTYMPVPERDYQSPIVLEDFRGYTSPFGIRLDPTKANVGGMSKKNHTGQDMTGETVAGTPDALVQSIGKGIVKTKWYSKGYHKINGRVKWFAGHPVFDGYVVVEHPNGDESEYGHLDEIYVHEGEEVDMGTTLGRISKKLNGLTTGAHLHFALRNKEGVYLPPFRYVNMPREVL